MNVEIKRIPRHVAVIMDGNGRWAAKRKLPRVKGHEEGAESVVSIIRACSDIGIEYLTLYAFSTENWLRPESEVKSLMGLLLKFISRRESDLHENHVRLRVIGRIADLSRKVRNELERVQQATKGYTKGNLILALSYGGRTEIADAVKNIAWRVKDGEISPDDVDEDMVAAHLYAPDIPDPDMLIRTSGEMRISNFLLWQISYAELYVTDTLWPDFREKEFRKALDDFSRRERRFGKVD